MNLIFCKSNDMILDSYKIQFEYSKEKILNKGIEKEKSNY